MRRGGAQRGADHVELVEFTLAECPFCAGEVDEDLITFGGPCPRCFADIPGEEAATDPGEEVKAQQERQDHRRAALRALIPVVLAMPVVMCLGVTALWFAVLRPEPEIAVLDFDLIEEYPVPELVGAPDDEPAEVASTAGSSSGSRPAEVGGGSPRIGSAEPASDGIGRRENGADGPIARSDFDAGQGQRPARGGLTFGPTATQSRSGGVLDDPEQIMRMIQERMSAQVQTLRECYERQLKVNDSLQGKWRISYVVGKKGRTSDAAALGLGMKDAELEACMARKIQGWVFQPISQPNRVQRTIAFTQN